MSGDLAAPGKPLRRHRRSSALQLEADVPEAIASHIKRGSRLGFSRGCREAASLNGIVSEIAPAADPVSRTFRVKLDLPAQPG